MMFPVYARGIGSGQFILTFDSRYTGIAVGKITAPEGSVYSDNPPNDDTRIVVATGANPSTRQVATWSGCCPHAVAYAKANMHGMTYSEPDR